VKHFRLCVLFATFLFLGTRTAQCQTVNILSHSVIDANPPDSVRFERAAGNFTSTSYPSFFLGTDSNGYLYDANTGENCSIDVAGYYFESARPFTWGTDQYAGVIAGINGSTVWLENPLNWGDSVCNGWQVQLINPDHGHELHVVDLDGDGKMDVLASGRYFPVRRTGFMNFQDSYDSWPMGAFEPPSGDSIEVVAINGVNNGVRTNIVACNATDNSLYWYQNPGGSDARTANWTAHLIARTSTGGNPACNEGVTLASLKVGDRDIVIVASNEGGTDDALKWLPGLGYYEPGSDPDSPWTFHEIDNTIRYVHQIATDVLNGVPFFTIGEQEQTSPMCNSQGYDYHGSLYNGCRVAIFPWNGNGFNAPTIVSNLGMHNQALYQLDGVEYLAGANHNRYGATDPAYNLWKFNFLK
jgi:hypothetical protein